MDHAPRPARPPLGRQDLDSYPMSNRGVVEAYLRAVADDDLEAQDFLLHDDYVLDYPQSGERFRGRDNRRGVVENYPLRVEARIRPKVDRIIGADDTFVASPLPSWNMIHLVGSGDDFQATGTITYHDGSTWHWVSLLTLRGGKIWRETTYFAEPFEAPDWRAPFAERIE
jgi:ketosteroid isomerase-like protein